MPRVFVTRELPGERFAALRNDPDLELDIWPGDFPPGRDDLLEHVRGVDGLVCLITDRIDEAVLEAAGPQLKVVSQMAVGVDNVDLAACAARGIPVGNTPGVLTETTADIAFALILVTARRVAEAAEYVRRGDWETWGPTMMAGVDVHDATLGIVGFGAIGQAIARPRPRLRDAHALLEPHAAPRAGRRAGRLPAALRRAAGRVRFRLAQHRPDRGHPPPDRRRGAREDAAARDPDQHRARPDRRRGSPDRRAPRRPNRGAGLDVTEVEPVRPDSPLLSMPNVVVLPHIGSASMATRGKMADIAVANLRAALAGEPLPHQVG